MASCQTVNRIPAAASIMSNQQKSLFYRISTEFQLLHRSSYTRKMFIPRGCQCPAEGRRADLHHPT